MLKRLLLSITLLASLAGCGAMVAQNPSSAWRPVNVVAEGNDSRLLLKGADVVAYFTEGKYTQGSSEFTSTYEQVNFRFASAEHKALFDKEPTRYLPQFGGYCANGIAYGIPWGGDADSWKMIGGKLYIFGGQGSKDAFELDEAKNLTLANRYWTEEVAGNNSFLQRAKRLVLRVPHYQSGEQLAAAVAKAKSAAAGGK
jgi:YHS domain-containing protein